MWLSTVRLFRRRADRTPVLPRLGRPRLTQDDAGRVRCTACALCTAACLSHCIQLSVGRLDEAEAARGDRRASSFDIDLGSCVLCGLCLQACPVDALSLDGVLPQAAGSSTPLRLDLEALTRC